MKQQQRGGGGEQSRGEWAEPGVRKKHKDHSKCRRTSSRRGVSAFGGEAHDDTEERGHLQPSEGSPWNPVVL